MKLYANGCSFTWGGELIKVLHDEYGNILDENNPSEINQHRLNITWPKHLSDLLGCTEFHNHGMGCGSNARIVRKTLEFFVPKILAGEDMSDWTVAVQWTVPSRFEFFDTVSNTWAIAKNDHILFVKDRLFTSDEKEDILRSYYSLNNDVSWGLDFFTQVVTLGNFFKSNNINYVFTMIHRSFPWLLTETQLRYCNENFIWYNNDINTCAIDDMGIDKCQATTHPSELGHKQIADNLFSFLSKK